MGTIQKYREKTEELNKIEVQKEGEELSIEERWERIKKAVNGAIVRSRKWRRKKIGHKDWWDRSYTKKKREVKKIQEMEKRKSIKRKIYGREKKI